MDIKCSATDDFEVCFSLYEGPLMASAIFSLDDEEALIGLFQSAFRDARALKAGFSREEVEEMNRERAGAT